MLTNYVLSSSLSVFAVQEVLYSISNGLPLESHITDYKHCLSVRVRCLRLTQERKV